LEGDKVNIYSYLRIPQRKKDNSGIE